jgi:diaminopimelate epimerase
MKPDAAFHKNEWRGNDFVLIDNRAGDVHLDRGQIAHLCDRHAESVPMEFLLLEESADRADFRMRYFNSDGGEAEMCGNGARCFARLRTKSREHRKRSLLKPLPA